MWTELGRVAGAVPLWAWLVMVNCLAFTWYALGQVRELQHERRSVTLTVRVTCVVCIAALGVFWLFAVTLIDAIADGVLPASDVTGVDEWDAPFEDRDRTRRTGS